MQTLSTAGVFTQSAEILEFFRLNGWVGTLVMGTPGVTFQDAQ